MKYDYAEIKSTPNYIKIGSLEECLDNFPEEQIKESREKYRKIIEPWISAALQSEHLSVLFGAGLTMAVCQNAGIKPSSMASVNFGEFTEKINKYAQNEAKKMKRGQPNIEDQIRTAFSLLNGYEIDENYKSASAMRNLLNDVLREFSASILSSETQLSHSLESSDLATQSNALHSLSLLISFLSTFSSRTATRERTHIFTTNYDRFIEYGCDLAGIKILDRFWGKIAPRFQESPVNIDYYYHMPDVKNEFRFAEGVIRYSKIHGSIDWYDKNGIVFRDALRFGADKIDLPYGSNYSDHLMIYPNSMKSVETAFYPYSELFRDFSMEICRPNTTLFTYGYGFGDSHINKTLREMLSIPSAHIFIIAYSIDDKLIDFLSRINMAQVSLLAGQEFGNLENLINFYLPKSAINTITETASHLVDARKGYTEIIKGGEIDDQNS